MAMLRSDERSRAPVPSAPREGAPRQGSGSPAGDPAKVNMPPRRTWLTFMLVLLANFLLLVGAIAISAPNARLGLDQLLKLAPALRDATTRMGATFRLAPEERRAAASPRTGGRRAASPRRTSGRAHARAP